MSGAAREGLNRVPLLADCLLLQRSGLPARGSRPSAVYYTGVQSPLTWSSARDVVCVCGRVHVISEDNSLPIFSVGFDT